MTLDDLILRLQALRAAYPAAGGAPVDPTIHAGGITFEDGRVRITVLPTLREGRA